MNEHRPSSTSGPRPPGRPPRVSRDLIVKAARRIVDDEGVARLTMRRLADEVGTTPMALYHHVRDKDALLLLLLEDAAATLQRPTLPADPRERIVVVFCDLHDGLAALPWIVETLTSDDLMSEAALWYVEQVVDAAVTAGLSPRQAVHAYRTLWYYTVGEIIVRSTAARRRTARPGPTYRDEVFARIDADAYPRLGSVADDWAELTARDTYRDGLRALVDGLLPPTLAPNSG
jgi:AcrR family transcriptional regulator